MLISSAKTLGGEWWRWWWWSGDGLIQPHMAGGKTYMFTGRNPDSSYSTVTVFFSWCAKFTLMSNSFCSKQRGTNPTWRILILHSNKPTVWGDQTVLMCWVHHEDKWSNLAVCAERKQKPKEKNTFTSLLFTGPILPPWAWWQLTVARRPETSFLQSVQQNNCIVFSCQKLTGWNKIVAQGTAMDTQGLDYGSESRHNCVKGKTIDVKGRVKNIEKRSRLTASVTFSW